MSKRLIDHLYYFENPKGTEYKKYKSFINGYLGKYRMLKINNLTIHGIGHYQSFIDIRNQRIDQLLKNKKENYENKLKDEKSTLCKRLSKLFN